MQQQTSSLTHEEARAELTAMLDEALGRIPTDLVVDHLMSAYADCGWPVLRDAGLALVRRIDAMEREGLRVAARPPGGAARGRWSTRRARGPERPYEIIVVSIDPLSVRCDCPDYGKGGLGLCKHGLVVLRELASKRKAFARLRERVGAGPQPTLSWWPFRAIEGPGDWLEGVRLSPSARGDLPPPLRRVARPIDGGGFRLDTERLVGDKLRRKVLGALESLPTRGLRDPALGALVRVERAVLDRSDALRSVRARLDRFLSDLDLRLYPYQREGVERFFARGRMLLADDMGLGKTVQATAIAHALVRAGRARRVLVVAPASLKSQWVREWRRATDVPIAIVEGGPTARAAIYDATDRGVLVCNYEQVWRDLDLMRGWAPELVILDEAQRIKNWATRTARTVKELDPPFRLVLTGTPLENRLDELASIMDWVDPFALAPKWRLAAAHDITADGTREVIGIGRLEVLRQRLAPHMLRRRRAEILTDLPPRTDTIHAVEMTAAQVAAHADLDLPIAQLVQMARRRGLTQAQFLRLMSLLMTQRVIANGMAQLQFEHVWPSLRGRHLDDATLQTIAMPKLGHLRDLVEAVAVDQRRKIVVFSQWRRALVLGRWAIGDLLEQAGLRAAFFSGQESQRQRTKNVVEFHDDPSLAVLLCTDAGGVGLNLQRAASCCINLELPWNPAVLEQRIARLHRLGQPEPIDVHMLVSEASIEQRIATAVANKRALFSGLFDGSSEEVRFDGARGFLSTVERLVDGATILGAGDGEADEQGEELDAGTQECASETLVDRADEHGDGQATAGANRLDAARDLAPLPSAEHVAALMADLRVEPQPDGRVRIDASPDAARTLGALLSGVAQLLEQAARREPPDAGMTG